MDKKNSQNKDSKPEKISAEESLRRMKTFSKSRKEKMIASIKQSEN